MERIFVHTEEQRRILHYLVFVQTEKDAPPAKGSTCGFLHSDGANRTLFLKAANFMFNE